MRGGERSRVTRVGEGQGRRAKRGGVCSGRSGAGKGGAGGCARRAREEVAGRAGRGRERSSCGSGKGRPLSSLARASACRRPGSSCDWARRWSPRQWRLSPPSPALSAARRGLPQPPRPPGACRQHPWPARSRGYAEAKRETAIWMPGWRAPPLPPAPLPRPPPLLPAARSPSGRRHASSRWAAPGTCRASRSCVFSSTGATSLASR